jgi:hypothetical protein
MFISAPGEAAIEPSLPELEETACATAKPSAMSPSASGAAIFNQVIVRNEKPTPGFLSYQFAPTCHQGANQQQRSIITCRYVLSIIDRA